MATEEEIKTDPNYDFNAPIEKTSVEIAKFIISKMDELKEFVIVENSEKLDPIKKAAFIEKSTDMSIDIMKQMAASDIPADYATTSIDKIIVILETLKSFVKGTVNQYSDEMMARYLGARSPKTGKFAAECVTLGDLIIKLEGIRAEQGGNKYDYFSEPVAEAAAADAAAGGNDGAAANAGIRDPKDPELSTGNVAGEKAAE